MQDILSRIDGLTQGARFAGWKFSVDGRWDIGHISYFRDFPHQPVESVLAWFHQQETANIAFQAMFDYDNGETFFFGLRMTLLTREEKEEVIRKLLTAGKPSDSLAIIIQKIRDCLDTQSLAATPPEYLELGVIAIWNRVKGLVVWRANEKILMLPEAIATYSLKPEEGFAPLHQPQPNQLMLGAAWKAHPEQGQRFQCWIGLPVTEFGKVPNKHTLSAQRYFATAKAFIG